MIVDSDLDTVKSHIIREKLRAALGKYTLIVFYKHILVCVALAIVAHLLVVRGVTVVFVYDRSS